MILAMEAGYDATTLPLSQARVRLLHPLLRKVDSRARVFVGAQAQAAAVSSAGAWAARLATASGHGDDWTLVEFGGMNPLLEGHRPSPLSAGCIVHLAACSSAQELGPALVSQGCSAVVGYNDLLLLPDDRAGLELLVRCDNQVVASLLRGATVGEAWQAAQAAYASAVKRLRDAGKALLAGLLEENARRLVSPVVSDGLGEAGAHL